MPTILVFRGKSKNAGGSLDTYYTGMFLLLLYNPRTLLAKIPVASSLHYSQYQEKDGLH